MKYKITSWFSAGIDEAILHFVKGGLRFAAAAAIYYGVTRLTLFQATTPEAVVAVGLIDRVLKSAYVWLTTGPDDVVPAPALPETNTSGFGSGIV